MPIYEYRCSDCGVQFEKLVRRMGGEPTLPCPECGTASEKQVSAAAFSFTHVPVGGPRPQNTGVHALDYNADRVIGRDAEQRWKTIEARQSRKQQLMRDNDVSGHDLARSPGGQDYHVMKPEERRASERARNLHSKALSVIEAEKSMKTEKKAG